jgi:hypothetical protein
MGENSEQLKIHRENLTKYLDLGATLFRHHWTAVEPLIDKWWDAYKVWEANDTFDKAFRKKRMTVRTFPGGDKGFAEQVSKNFGAGTISLASYDKKTRDTEVRVFADSQYTPLGAEALKEHDRVFHKTDEKSNYMAQRGIDSSAFANPDNFATRETKYAAGLHDLSASLLNPELSIFDQIHNTDKDAHFSFLPLSKEEDQYVLFTLTQYAKTEHLLPALYNKVRRYRAEMTRVKVANEFDMGIVYSAVPVADHGAGPAYKLRYGLGKKTTITGPQGQETVMVTPQIYAARRQAAIKFKSIVGIRDGKNEVVIAIRRHAGRFPVYAVRNGDHLECYNIVNGGMAPDGRRISSNGVMTG